MGILNYQAWWDTVACLGALEKLEYSLPRRWASVGALWRGVLSGWRLPIRPIREEQWTI
jgi:hypothetical protein